MSTDWRSEFELDESLVYLNSGSHSIAPRAVVEAVQREVRDFERNPSAGLFGAWERLWAVHEGLAGFFNAPPTELFLRPNVTDVLNLFILSCPLPRGSEILISDLEYGAIANIARFRAERDGLKLRAFTLPAEPAALAELTPERLAQGIASELRPETSLLVLSHVITGHGLTLPIARIARAARAQGVKLVVDGAHAPGFWPLDFSQLQDVDFYGGNLHKWMLGPKGTAFGWVPTRNHGLLTALGAGWTTYDINDLYQDFGRGCRFSRRLLASACQDFSPYFAIPATLAFWRRHGFERITRRVRELQARVEREVAARLGWPCLSPPPGPLRGPLLSFALPEAFRAGAPVPLSLQLLREHGVQVLFTALKRQRVVRLSPHIHNADSDIPRAVQALERFA